MAMLALACEMSRFDPRLFGILVSYFLQNWRKINPVDIRLHYKDMACPQTIAVVGEFVTAVAKDNELIFFIQYLNRGLFPVAYQFYFHNLYAPGGKLAARAVEEGLCEFKKWGFFACERPVINLSTRETAGSLDAASRLNILKGIVKEKKEISIGDYLEATRNSISRQQALLDIKESGLVIRVGNGRGARWKAAA
ncbi:MAG: hypothetical protein HYU98_07380 [Deltaproteobacteria bacterium]|nr:hypothetical protein [Deltaproteobacteria bacterium]